MINIKNFFYTLFKKKLDKNAGENVDKSLLESSSSDEDGDQNFISNIQDSTQKSENSPSKINEEDSKKIDDIIEFLRKNHIMPVTNQQRNLDREEGGLEQENNKTESVIIDEWDDRGEEIIKMAESHPINNSTGKKSMLWNLKRKKLQEKKIKEEISEISGDLKELKMEKNSEQTGSEFDSRNTKSSLTQRINALSEDRNDFKPVSKIR
jgi:vacuolar-type H+-ATPase subunit I/STV1